MAKHIRKFVKKKPRLAGVGWSKLSTCREDTPKPAPGVQTQYRDLNLGYFRLADETQAALRRLLQYEMDHPELFR